MSIVDQYGRPVRSGIGGGGRLLDGAANRGNHPVQPVLSESAWRSITEWDLKTVVSASRRLYANNGIFRGAIAQKSMFAVGRAWEPVFQGRDEEWGKLATKWLVEEWMPNCDVRGEVYDFKTCIYLDSISIDRDGDIGHLFTEDEHGFPKIQRIEQHRIQSKGAPQIVTDGEFKGCPIVHGVIVNPQGKPLAYRVYEDEIGAYSSGMSYVDIPAWAMALRYDPDFYSQFRGLPALSHAINAFRSMALSQEWEELNMLIASAISLIEENESGAPDASDLRTHVLGATGEDSGSQRDLQVMSLERGLIRYFKAGTNSKLSQFINSKPGQDWEIFNDRLVRIALLGLNWPLSMVWKAEGTGTDTRSDILKARMAVEDRQALLLPIAKRQIQYALAKAMQLGLLPFSEDWMTWTFSMPPKIGIDDGRERKELREDLAAGLITQQAVASAMGGDWRANSQQLEIEADAFIATALRIAERNKIPLQTAINAMRRKDAKSPIKVEGDEASEEVVDIEA